MNTPNQIIEHHLGIDLSGYPPASEVSIENDLGWYENDAKRHRDDLRTRTILITFKDTEMSIERKMRDSEIDHFFLVLSAAR